MTAWQNVALKPSKKREGPAGEPNRRLVTDQDLRDVLTRVRTALKAAKLSEVEESTSFGTPSIKVRGKFLMRVKDQDTLVFRCPIEEKPLLMAAAPDIYFETDHYRGWPAILVRLAKTSDAELKHCLERAWRFQAPATLVRRFDGTTAVKSKSPKRRRN
ncbi:MAG: MmcQ/YjbR family DNA-binding protein [Bradyrhizobiaceae bacterium]|nr:MmcQ/YjbR family DNA-binding protein [Bradyrhizobiaceae bacterium]